MWESSPEGLALQQHFPYKSTTDFPKIQNVALTYALMSGVKLGHLAILDALFLFLAFFKS